MVYSLLKGIWSVWKGEGRVRYLRPRCRLEKLDDFPDCLQTRKVEADMGTQQK